MSSALPAKGAVIYIRVSTEEQAMGGTSLTTQRDICMARAELMGLPVAAICEDAGVSGTKYESRPGIMEALRLIETGAASVLIAAKIDRVGRSARIILSVADRVERAGGELVTGDLGFDGTPGSRLMRTIYAGMAEMERETIRERTMSGKRRRAEQGQQPQRSSSPYGYHIVTNAEVEAKVYPSEMRGRYVVDEEKAPIVRRIFAEAKSGLTQSRIARCLNKEGVPSPENGRWWPGSVGCILGNTVYKGEPLSGRIKCHSDESRLSQFHKLTGVPITTTDVRRLTPPAQRLTLSAPSIVSIEDWDAVQQRREQNRAGLTGNPRRARMLSGKATCPHCGGKAIIKYQHANGKCYPYLTCSVNRRERALSGERACSGEMYPLALMEESAARVVLEVCERPESLAEAEWVYRTAPEPQNEAELRRELAALDKTLTDLKSEQDVAVRAQVAGIMAGASPDAYASLFADIAARRKDMEDRRGRVRSLLTAHGRQGRAGDRQEGKPHMSEAVRQALKDAHAVLTNPNVPGVTKRDILLPIVARVVCHKDGVEVDFAPGLFHEDTGGKSGTNELTKPPAWASARRGSRRRRWGG